MTTTYTLAADQEQVAQRIIEVGKAMGATDAEISAALSTGISESGLHTTSTGDSGAGLGVFQQHPSYGDEPTRRDPVKAATAFFRQLIAQRGDNEPVWVSAADVQRPAGWHPGGPANWTGPNPFLYRDNLATGTQVYQRLGSSGGFSGLVGGRGLIGGGAGAVTHDQITANTPTSTPVYGILRSIDATLNVKSSGLADLLNPIDDLRVIVARGAVVLAGAIVTTFGFVLIVGSLSRAAGVGSSVITGLTPSAPEPAEEED